MAKFSFDTPAVYLITKGEATPENFAEKSHQILDVVRAAVDAGVTLVQVREKKLTAKLLYELACEVTALTRVSGTRFLINDRADIARAAGCDGVQLTSASLCAGVVRAAFGAEFLIGVSTHSFEEVESARDQGADFAVFGPVFETPGKKDVKGLTRLAEVCEATKPFPVIGIGGIDSENCASVTDAGAAGYAAIRWLNNRGLPAR